MSLPVPGDKVDLTLELDGATRTEAVDPRMLLLEALRDGFGALAPKVGCLNGDCGACTVEVDDTIVKSCLELAVASQGVSVRTIEGLADGTELTPVQHAFWDHGAFQCGYCLSGMLFSAEDLLARDRNPTEAKIREAISGNLCRCTGYQHIVDAIVSLSGHDATRE